MARAQPLSLAQPGGWSGSRRSRRSKPGAAMWISSGHTLFCGRTAEPAMAASFGGWHGRHVTVGAPGRRAVTPTPPWLAGGLVVAFTEQLMFWAFTAEAADDP